MKKQIKKIISVVLLFAIVCTGQAFAQPIIGNDAYGLALNVEAEEIVSESPTLFLSSVNDPESIEYLVNKTVQLPSNYVPGLKKIPSEIASKYMRARPEAVEALVRMSADAKLIGLNIYAVSAYRSYREQNRIFWSLVQPKGPQTLEEREKVSARAGHSEHQTGLAIDVMWIETYVEDTPEYQWYKDNAHLYGFIIRYQLGKEGITGYNYEPWHLRFVGTTLAGKIYQSGLTYEEYVAQNATK